MRRWAVPIHRWTGLVIAAFLVMAGVTGALLAWSDDIEQAVAPTIFTAPAPAPGTPLLDPFTLRDRVAIAYPHADVSFIELDNKAGVAARFFLSPRKGEAPLANDEVFIDPATGRITGARRWGDMSQGLRNLMPFLLRLHYSFALGDVGIVIFGVIALLWTIDCFIGAWLTLPLTAKKANQRFPRRSWWTRWAPSWRVRRNGWGYKLNFDLHRAGGLWLWVLLFIFAWSSVAFNLNGVYQPLTRALLGYHSAYDALPDRGDDSAPHLDWRSAYARARIAMAAETKKRGLAILSERRMALDIEKRAYVYRVRSSRDVSQSGDSNLYLDADTGRTLGVEFPTEGPAGNVVTTWIVNLHTADIFGDFYRVIVSGVGVAVAGLSMTGIIIWLRKRTARQQQRTRCSKGRSLQTRLTNTQK